MAAFIIFATAPAYVRADEPSASWEFPPGQTTVVIPARFSPLGDIIVRMNVQGRGIDMLVDTGSSQTTLDSSVYRRLGFGQNGASSAVIDSAEFGPATLHNLPVTEGSFFRRESDGSLIVGLLGYEFFKPGVVKIDYDHEQLQLIDPAKFTAPQSALQFSLLADEKVPFVGATIGSVTGGWFIIDTGATTVMVFPRFVAQAPEEFGRHQELGKDPNASYYEFFWPLCGHVDMQPYAVSQIKLDDDGVKDWVVWKVPSDSCFNLKRVDGLIGYDILRLFDVFIDYPANLVVLAPNDVYTNAPNTFR